MACQKTAVASHASSRGLSSSTKGHACTGGSYREAQASRRLHFGLAGMHLLTNHILVMMTHLMQGERAAAPVHNVGVGNGFDAKVQGVEKPTARWVANRECAPEASRGYIATL